ncbi:D-alanyl-D-alanine carboxypeptidase [Roseibacterium sp. SDUM158017]|nr:D-alanyl-D-alanine carboxypeptidase family protein [Roseibacterium sp. SDUM158017]MDG4647134.1 D-alanyl-D-alanine carboxypeptidase [Roseibacterium sp. SDUM158017]
MTALCGLILVACLAFSGPARAAPYAAMVMDARTGEVLHSRNADTRLHPASLTKMMTLYLAFEAVRLGEIGLDTEVRISANAAAEPPSKIGLRQGSTIRFRFLIRAAAIRSANDAATAIGEALEGSEAAFARRMNRTARALGMTRTTFRNAHGLTEEGHMSTARDMTILGRRLHYDYPQYYNIFSRREDNAGIATVRNTNRAFLNAYSGADGIKTGYTRAAGFNLVASARRGDERIIATVFGGQSTAWRNQRVMELLDMGFQRAPSTAPVRVPPLPTYDDVPDDENQIFTALVARSIRPLQRPLAAPAAELLAAIDAAVGEAVGEAVAEAAAQTATAALLQPAPRPAGARVEAIAPEAVAAALTEALEPPSAEAAAAPGPEPLPRPEPQSAVAEAPLPQPVATEVVTRASSTGSRLFGVSLGYQSTEHAAERLLLQTALAELGTFDDALRRVVRRSGGFDARFAGMTEDQARRACARLAARAMPCETFGP